MTAFDEAVCFAVRAHAGQYRKADHSPYILHPMETAAICAAVSTDPELLAAAVLRDTVEDCGVSLEELSARFGPRVARLVAAETEDKRRDLPPAESWRLRKEESLKRLARETDPAARILWLGDKLSNLRSFRRLWLRQGDGLWQSFHQKDPAQQAWYYRAVEEALAGLRDTAAWQELHAIVEELFPEGGRHD